MANWVTLNTGSMPIIGSVSAITDSLVGPLEATADLANTAAGIMGTLAAIAGAAVDPLGAVKGQIDSLINDLVGSGVYGLVIAPELRERSTAPRGADGFLRVVKEAMNDYGDTNRPPFTHGDSSAGIIFMVSSPNAQGLAGLAEAFQLLFGPAWTDLIAFANSKPSITPRVQYETSGVVTALVPGEDERRAFVDSTQNFTVTRPNYDPYKGQLVTSLTGRNAGQTTRVASFDNSAKIFRMVPGFRFPLEVGDGYALSYNTQSKPPDWKSFRLVDAIPITADVVETLARVRDSMPAYGMSTQFDRLAQILTAKAALFTNLAGEIQSLADAFDALGAVSGVHMLPISPQSGGNAGFMREAYGAGNPPAVGPTDKTLGVVLYGGSGVFSTLGKIFPI